MTAYNTVNGASRGHGLNPVLGERPHDGGGTPTCAVVASRFIQGPNGPCDVCWRLGRGVLGSCGPFLDPGKIGCIIAIPPLVEPTFRADQLPTDVLDLVVGKVCVDGLLRPLCCALRHGRCLCTLRLSCAESILLRVCFVLDVLAHMMWRARTPGVDDGKPVQAACLEPPAPVPTGAGVGVSSKPWLRDNDLDAQERSQTQWLTP